MSCAGRTLLKLCASSCEARIIVVAGRVVSLNEKEVPVRMGLRSINAIAHVTRQAHIPKCDPLSSPESPSLPSAVIHPSADTSLSPPQAHHASSKARENGNAGVKGTRGAEGSVEADVGCPNVQESFGEDARPSRDKIPMPMGNCRQVGEPCLCDPVCFCGRSRCRSSSPT